MKSYDERIESIFRKYDERIGEKKRRRTIAVRSAVSAAACAVLILALNQVSLLAYGENMFSRIYHFTGRGVAIHLEEESRNNTIPTGSSVITGEDIKLPSAEGDPYGIRKKCAEYGLHPLTPFYIPEGFRLVEIETENDIKINAIRFAFKRGDEMIELEYGQYKTDEMVFEIPADSKTITEREICGRMFAVIHEEDTVKAFCADDRMLYGIFTTGLDSKEADRIIDSLS